jgi:hypothetical protein
MIINNHVRKQQVENRIKLRDRVSILSNVIENGSNCSHFEADLITEKALEVFRLGDYSFDKDKPLQPGQMVWQAIRADEPPGKPLAKCEYRRIVLTAHRLDEDREVKLKHGNSSKRGQQILRMSREAESQETLLTVEDLAVILDCDEKTIRSDIKLLKNENGIGVPTRGNKCDIGPGVTHKHKAVELFIKGIDEVAIARNMKHSIKAIHRYINDFSKIVYTQSMTKDSLQTALITGCSIKLIGDYMELKYEYLKTESYRERIKDIESKGLLFWDAEGFKKKAGQ